jgi:hypothetical protein
MKHPANTDLPDGQFYGAGDPPWLERLRCACGSADILSIKPGQNAVYAWPRDLSSNIDKRRQPVVFALAIADQAWCAACSPWLKRKPEARGHG